MGFRTGDLLCGVLGFRTGDLLCGVLGFRTGDLLCGVLGFRTGDLLCGVLGFRTGNKSLIICIATDSSLSQHRWWSILHFAFMLTWC